VQENVPTAYPGQWPKILKETFHISFTHLSTYFLQRTHSLFYNNKILFSLIF
jgi:hypothetical protein